MRSAGKDNHMAHEFESGLFVGEPAWHRLGVVLEQPPSIDDAIRLAGLDWEVRLAPLALAEDGRAVSHRATVRGSDNAILGNVVPLFEGGRGAELSRGTLWGAYNAVTEYITHERGRSDDARVESAWFGEGARLARRALDVALEFARAA